jgi:hypothetical protein
MKKSQNNYANWEKADQNNEPPLKYHLYRILDNENGPVLIENLLVTV